MSSISSVNCDFLLVWRLFRNLMNTRLRNLTITSQAFGFGVKYPEPTTLDQIYEKGARVLKAVVFDMDETLLSINLNAFILRYFKDVSSMLADIGSRSRGGTMARLGTILVDLNANRRSGTDNRTNLEFYQEEVERRCGICLSDPLIYEAFTYYDREILPYKNDEVINAHAMPGAHAALQAVQDAGLRCALFTNPSFPQGAIECRMGWGDLADAPFELVTHMGNTTRCKPDATYYLEQLQVMGLEPHEVLMVGNDPKRDFPSPDCGIQTAFVGQGKPSRATWRGTMEDFARDFNAVIEAFYEHQIADELS